MKRVTIASFTNRNDAEEAIKKIRRELDIETDDISYVYRNIDGDVREVTADDMESPSPAEGAKTGAKVGGTLGALAGIAAIAGVLPVLGPVLLAGPLLAAVGITGAAGGALAGGAAGAVAGGIIGALINLGVTKEGAQRYVDEVKAGNILLVVHTDEEKSLSAGEIMARYNAVDVNTYTPSV